MSSVFFVRRTDTGEFLFQRTFWNGENPCFGDHFTKEEAGAMADLYIHQGIPAVAIEFCPRIETLREAARLVCERCRIGMPMTGAESGIHECKCTDPDCYGLNCVATNIHREIARLEAGNG